eukprot:TRINITY_DN10210_c0_g1_i1.p1 TRINITY_DN10210_c0_g1~~TRINITY_DN10210_c0_g1_i1.p1  ORF type:complete len:110 (-),score=12.27 TRINITY_DN10210_c0_g1_i1:80-409(-)
MSISLFLRPLLNMLRPNNLSRICFFCTILRIIINLVILDARANSPISALLRSINLSLFCFSCTCHIITIHSRSCQRPYIACTLSIVIAASPVSNRTQDIQHKKHTHVLA